MKIKPVNLNKTLKLLEGTKAEKPFIEDMLLYMDQAKEYEEKKVLQSNLYEELNSSLVYRYKTIVNNAQREDLSIIAISGEETIGSNVDVFLENTAVRFKVRDKLNESGYSVAVKVKDGKTVLDVDMKQAGFTALKTLSNELEELKPWVNDYMATLKEQVSDSVQAQALPDTIEPYKTSWVELPEERRILVKVHPENMATFKSKFSSPKWEKDLKAWRISNLQSNKDKLNDFRDLLELRRRQEHESPKEVLSKVDTVIDGKPHYYELSHKVEHESLTSKFDTLTLDLKSDDGSYDGAWHKRIGSFEFVNLSDKNELNKKAKEFLTQAMDLRDNDLKNKSPLKMKM
ncbi:hypothetical protein DNR33_20480 [Escherichia coli]|uniref:hypothetical protein n=1 Tax=Escherichia coli TaxID=562 RepID=UPI001659DC34|nr:hypothetical protein [Escherichia coli]EGD9591871.1 hypothetical protein [Escherichia coli]EGQ0766384.1 hypothetical protein [Escherichia coli]MBC9405156.1 hypothetical protein [Escherichia coli]HBH9081906.1 hypothetical protein [Escherichia coli]HDX2101071.1 hypothetical protein [Escherichia coli]